MSKKKANGEGSIVKRKDGRYMARYTMGDKRCAIYGSTFEEVRVQLTDTLSKIDQGIHITPTGYTVSKPQGSMKSWCRFFSAKRTILVSMLGQYRGPTTEIVPSNIGLRWKLSRMIRWVSSLV